VKKIRKKAVGISGADFLLCLILLDILLINLVLRLDFELRYAPQAAKNSRESFNAQKSIARKREGMVQNDCAITKQPFPAAN
jgi:hypothetical protein